MKIAVILLGDVYSSEGTNIRARRVLELLYPTHELVLIHCSKENNKSLAGMEGVQIINLGDKVLNFISSQPQFSPVKALYSVLWGPKLAIVILTHHFDILYYIWDFMGFMGTNFIAQIKKIKTIFEAHSIISADMHAEGRPRIMVKMFRIIEKFVMKRADLIVALSDNALKAYKTYNPAIEFFPAYVDTDRFINKSSNRPSPFYKMKRVGLIGPFDISKRHRYYLDFLYNHIEQFDNSITFLVIGRCQRKLNNERIVYTGYLNSTADYITHLCRLDIVLVPEMIGTAGPLTKIIESMSCALPVFTTPAGLIGLHEVEPGKDIFVYKIDDLVEKVNQQIYDEARLHEVGTNARVTVEKYYSEKVVKQRFIHLVESLWSE